MLDNAIKELEKELKDHEKNPEKHPLYPEEWKTFWNRRYKELQAGNTHKLTGIVIFFLVISLRDTWQIKLWSQKLNIYDSRIFCHFREFRNFNSSFITMIFS